MIKIIAEIGINHSGKYLTAKKLIDQARLSNCWGVKFQYRNIASFYSSSFEIGDEILSSELKRSDLSYEEYLKLIEYSKSKDLKVGFSFFRKEDAIKCDFIKKLDFLKVPSAECLNFDLIKYLLKFNKLLFISTGGHNNFSIKTIINEFKNKLIYLHCIANYPVEIGNQNLKSINWLINQKIKEVGYSSHDLDYNVCLLAMSQGARWIERHITLDKKGSGLDDSTSSNIQEFQILTKFADNFSNILGTKNKTLNQGELLNIQNLGTSLYAKNDFSTGEIIDLKKFEARAPRRGITKFELNKNIKKNKYFLKPIKKGEPLSLKHVICDNLKIKDNCIEICKKNKVAIPVRCHDYSFYKSKFPINSYEFHLSFNEVYESKYKNIISKISIDENISIHLPDYLDKNRLFNPISVNDDIRRDSLDILDKVVLFGKEVAFKSGKKIPIVGSFSEVENLNDEEFVLKIKELINDYGNDTFIYPQWLPGYAWYFGGSVKLNSFNSQNYVNLVNKHKLDICLDISHLVLSANYRKVCWKKWFNLLEKRTKHIHLSDAKGIFSEGLGLKEGEFTLYTEVFNLNCMKVIEVWQGHLDEGFGFKKEINKMDILI